MSNCFFLLIFTELTPEQQKNLIDIRRKKTELLLEIQVIRIFLKMVIEIEWFKQFNHSNHLPNWIISKIIRNITTFGFLLYWRFVLELFFVFTFLDHFGTFIKFCPRENYILPMPIAWPVFFFFFFISKLKRCRFFIWIFRQKTGKDLERWTAMRK